MSNNTDDEYCIRTCWGCSPWGMCSECGGRGKGALFRYHFEPCDGGQGGHHCEDIMVKDGYQECAIRTKLICVHCLQKSFDVITQNPLQMVKKLPTNRKAKNANKLV